MSAPTLVGVLYFLVATQTGLIAWGIRAILKGDLTTKKSLAYMIEIWKENIARKEAEAAEWKAHYESERAIGVNNRENREILLAVSKTMEKVLSSLSTTATAKDTNVGG